MLLRALSIQKPLLYRLTAGIIIYLRDHNKLINPQNSKINVSYCNPKNIVPEAPSQPFIEYKLDPEMQELLDRQIFEEYKNKLLRGIIDEEKAVHLELYRKSRTRFGVKTLFQSTTLPKLASWT
jgi:hypothetical protein